MEFNKALKERRSIRKYKNKKVEFDKLAEILDSVRYAPCAGNIQNWKIVVVGDKEKRKEITDACLKQKWMNQAPVFLVVGNDKSELKKDYKGYAEKFSVQTIGAVIQNIMLKAHDLGLGSCWVGTFDEQAIKRVLKIPEEIEIEAVVTVGYSDEEVSMPKKYEIKTFTNYNEWGKKR